MGNGIRFGNHKLLYYTATNLFWYKFYRHYTKNQFVVKIYPVKP